MIDRVVHHADVLTLKGTSYRLRNRGIETCPASGPKARQTTNATNRWPRFRASDLPHFRALPTQTSDGRIGPLVRQVEATAKGGPVADLFMSEV